MCISEKCMLVNLRVHCWQARKYDKKISAEVSEKHAATTDAGRYNKHLLPGDTLSYDKVKTAAGEIRAFHYANTLPWSQDGFQILTAANFLTYSDKMRLLQEEYASLANDFLVEYPQLKENARLLLNGMYRPEDYPSPTEIKGKFGVEINFLPLPDADDFRVKLADEDVSKIRASIKSQVRSELENAHQDIWQRLYVAVQRMVERLAKPDAIFRDSLVTNMQELVDLIPRLNVMKDENLENIRKVAASALTVHAPQTLREDKDTRAMVAQQAQEIASVMEAFMLPA